jgi:hypothetical protein
VVAERTKTFPFTATLRGHVDDVREQCAKMGEEDLFKILRACSQLALIAVQELISRGANAPPPKVVYVASDGTPEDGT